jgi:hypothetical protein
MANRGTAISADYASPIFSGGVRFAVFTVKSGETIYSGALFKVVSGEAVAIGVQDDSTDSSAVRVYQNAGQKVVGDGALKVTGRYDCQVALDILAADPVAVTDITNAPTVYAASAFEVAATETNGSGKAPKIGKLVGIEDGKAIVHLLPHTL